MRFRIEENWIVPLPRKGERVIFGDDPTGRSWLVTQVTFHYQDDMHGTYVQVSME